MSGLDEDRGDGMNLALCPNDVIFYAPITVVDPNSLVTQDEQSITTQDGQQIEVEN